MPADKTKTRRKVSLNIACFIAENPRAPIDPLRHGDQPDQTGPVPGKAKRLCRKARRAGRPCCRDCRLHEATPTTLRFGAESRKPGCGCPPSSPSLPYTHFNGRAAGRRLAHGHPIVKNQNGFVISFYVVCRSRSAPVRRQQEWQRWEYTPEGIRIASPVLPGQT